jgi:mRNA interferase RelE/StbE
MFDIKFNSRCQKILKKYHKEVRTRILNKIILLRNEPVPSDAKKIINVKGKMFRIRIGDYRVLYVINFKDKEIYISNIDKRERIY